MSLPRTLSQSYLYKTARSVQAEKMSLEVGKAELIRASEWGNPSDGEMNRVDTWIQEMIREQRDPTFALLLAELNLTVCQAVGSPSQEVICSNTVGEAITALKDPRLTARRIEVYKSALKIVESSGDQRRAAILNNNLGNAYSELATGDLQENTRAAIECFERALVVFTPEEAPYAWASIQNNLATVHKMMPGDDDRNIKPAVVCWEKALTVFHKDAYPLEWANVQRNLGIALKDLNTGDPVENSARAEEHLRSALEIFTPDQQPVLWAEVQNALGNVFFRLTTGDRTSNLNEAITCYEQALAVRSQASYPVQFAATHVNLGNAWLSLPTGNRAQSVRHAIACFEKALKVYSPADFPEYNAQVHANLAAAYFYLPAGDRVQNLRIAEQSLQIALDQFTRSHNALQVAWCQSTQGAVYQEIAGTDPAFVPKAVACFQAACEVYDEHSFPMDFARVMDSLGTLYRSGVSGDRLTDFQKAEDYYKAALRVYRSDSYPEDWASTQTNLGNCYLTWPASDRSRSLPKAVECYRSALSIHTRAGFPLDYARLMDGLGTAYGMLSVQDQGFRAASTQCLEEAWNAASEIGAKKEAIRIAGNGGSLFWRQGQWAPAYEWLAKAIGLLEAVWEEHYSSAGKAQLQAEHEALFIRLTQACHALGRNEDALNNVERSRGRYLLSILAETIHQLPAASPAIREKLARLSALSEEVRTKDAALPYALSIEQTLNILREQQALRDARREILGSLAQDIPEYVALLQGQPQDFQSLQNLLRMA